MLGWRTTTDTDGKPLVIAAHINIERLTSDLIDPLLSTHSGLELVSAGPDYEPWSQPLYGAMRFWSMPSGSFPKSST